MIAWIHEVHIVQKPNTTSSIWNYFGVKADGNDVPIPDELEKPVCKLCNKPISAKQSNTTIFTCFSKIITRMPMLQHKERKLQEKLRLLANQLCQRFSRRMHDMIQSLCALKKLLAPSLFFLQKICSHVILIRNKQNWV